jgi:hypothetical protein
MASLNPSVGHVVGQVKGTITIPTVDPDGNKIVALGTMNILVENIVDGVTHSYPAADIEEIYFLEDSECVLFSAGCCKEMKTLREIHFPPNLQYIGAGAFE